MVALGSFIASLSLFGCSLSSTRVRSLPTPFARIIKCHHTTPVLTRVTPDYTFSRYADVRFAIKASAQILKATSGQYYMKGISRLYYSSLYILSTSKIGGNNIFFLLHSPLTGLCCCSLWHGFCITNSTSRILHIVTLSREL